MCPARLAAYVHLLRLCAAQLIADHMCKEASPDGALRSFAVKVFGTLESNAPPPEAGPVATRVHEMTGGRLNGLIADVRAPILRRPSRG